MAIARNAAVALRIAQGTANDVQHQSMLEGVLEVSARLAEADETEEVLQAVCDGIQDALGFDKVAIELAAAPGAPLAPVAASGWEMDAEAVNHGMTLEAIAPLFTREFEVAGCYLLPTEVAEERLGVHNIKFQSEMNGRGPHAWSRHWLLVPLVEPEGRRLGVIWVDDPRDRLLPTRARLQALRLFANQAVSALQSADQAAELRHEATHDALTGLPNRRAFLARLAREASRPEGTFALILCDMDNLKTLNDTHGHEAGDLALKLLADALRTGLRRSDDAFRIGGDEFAVVLGGASRLDAERVARRLQYAIPGRPGHHWSRSTPASGSPSTSRARTGATVARADEALYGTKRRRRESAA